MRWFLVLSVLTLLACSQEPSFDERYEKADKEIREKAASIDAELGNASEVAPSPAVTDEPR